MPKRDPFISTVLRTAQAQMQCLRGRSVLIGLSGGADSTSLLAVLLELVDALDLSVYAAHFDHALRPESGDQAEAVARTCASFGVRLYRGREDVAELAGREKISVEAAARQARYAFLASVARPLGAVVAVAHNRNDQAETVLWNLIRGSGLNGLTGMEPVSVVPGAPDVRLVRPLLGVSSDDIRDFCERKRLQVLEDESNYSDAYTRNRIRHEVIPRLEGINPQAVRHIAQTAELLRSDEAALADITDDLYSRAATERLGRVSMDRSALAGQPDAICARALRCAILSLCGTLDGFTRRHILTLLGVVRNGREGQAGDFPRGVRSLVVGGNLLLWRGEIDLDEVYPLPLIDESTAMLKAGWRWEANPDVCSEFGEVATSRLHEHVRYTDAAFLLRTARLGERFRPLGMGHGKAVSDFLASAKVPNALRRRVPVIEAEGLPVWLVGWRIDERWRLQETNERFVCLRAWQTDQHTG